MLLRLRLVLFSFIGAIGCVSPEPQTVVKVSKKAFDTCICGPLLNGEGQAHCAIWGREARAKILAAHENPSCLAADCSRFFSSSCQKIEMSLQKVAPPLPPQVQQGCYCDVILSENDKGQVRTLCAAWAEGSTALIEYYSLDDCGPNRCREPPFRWAKTTCKDSFRAFYSTVKLRP